jgi:leucyl aminopeptidase
MKYSLHTTDVLKKATDCLMAGVFTKGRLSPLAAELDRQSGKLISTVVKSGDIPGKAGDTLLLHTPAGLQARRVLLVGCGDEKEYSAKSFRKAVRAAVTALNKGGAREAVIALTALPLTDRDAAWALTQTVTELELASYRYDQTKSKKAEPLSLKGVALVAPESLSRRQAEEAIALGEAIGRGMNLARELGNLPGNICNPVYLADQARKLGATHKSLKIQILDEKQMQRLGMGSLLSVGAGSPQESRLIVMEYKGTSKAGSKPYVLIGKGITFDTGGNSLKPGLNMDEMKFDMCGAATVLGVMSAVTELKLPVNIVAVIAAAENMPGGDATRPGDIVTSMSGQTIEVLNTDAEGRLVLCDALTYVERFNPRTVIDVATLTGAAVATFGDFTSALLSNNEALAQEILDASQYTLDQAWQLPLAEEYQSLLDSNFADIANIGGPKAGTITAACFLSRFTKKYVWAHLDIAGTAWNSGAQKGATGRPVPLLVEYLRRQKA